MGNTLAEMRHKATGAFHDTPDSDTELPTLQGLWGSIQIVKHLAYHRHRLSRRFHHDETHAEIRRELAGHTNPGGVT